MRKSSRKVIEFPIASKSALETVTIKEFHKAFYRFLVEIKVVKTPEEYKNFIISNQAELNNYINHIIQPY